MTTELLIDYAHEVGVAMGSLAQGRHVGWTTDREKAMALREAGAELHGYSSSDPKFTGWEVTFAVGRERRTDVLV